MDTSNISDVNAFLVLDAIRHADGVTRVEIGQGLGLSEASVSRIVRRLIADGSVEELPGSAGDPGRTPTVLRFAPRRGAVISVDLGGTKCHGAVADLAGEILHEDLRPTGGASQALETVIGCIEALRALAMKEDVPVRCVVIGIAALIDPDTGLAAAGPNVGWNGFDLLRMLQERLAEPVEVDNDVNLAALGQAWRGEGVGVRSFVTISMGTGIGGAVVIDGRLIRGRHNAAGEIGNFLFGRNQLRDEFFEEPGFERLASGQAIRARALELLRTEASSMLSSLNFDTADVFSAALAGDIVGKQVIEELRDYVAMAITNVTALIDPDLVILDGSVGRALDPWLDEIKTLVSDHVFKSPQVVVSRLGPNGTVMGAVARGLALVSEMDASSTVAELASSVSPFAQAIRSRGHELKHGRR